MGRHIFLLLAVTALSIGCRSLQDYSPVDYDVSFKSHLREPMADVQARLGEFRAAIGYLAVDGNAGLGAVNRPFSPDAILYFRKEADGSYWYASVPHLRWDQLPIAERRGGLLRFTLDPETVSIEFVTKDGRTYLLGSTKYVAISAQEAPR